MKNGLEDKGASPSWLSALTQIVERVTHASNESNASNTPNGIEGRLRAIENSLEKALSQGALKALLNSRPIWAEVAKGIREACEPTALG